VVVVGTTARVISAHGAECSSVALGGAGFNVTVAARATGTQPRLITLVGTDLDAGEIAVVRLIAEEPYLSVVPGSTCQFNFHHGLPDGPPAVTSEYGVGIGLTEHAKRFNYADTHLHVCCRNPLNAGEILRYALRQSPARLSVDFIGTSLQSQLNAVIPYAEAIDWMFLNEREYAEASSYLADSAFHGRIVVTSGGDGARVLRNGNFIEQAQAPKTRVADATGAGDALAGTFIALLWQGRTVSEALQSGVDAGALAVTDTGVNAIVRRIRDV
jgi:sugar/nucleoside kinase (ribokinase family)